MTNFFTCPECGLEFTAKKDPETGGVVCPSCQVVIPAWAEPLADKDPAPTGPGAPLKKPCPVCKAPAKMDAVICLQCGYNWTTGRVPTREQRATSMLKDIVTFVLLFVAIGALTYAGYRVYQGRGSEPITAQEPTMPTSALPPLDREGEIVEEQGQTAEPIVAAERGEPPTVSTTPESDAGEQTDSAELEDRIKQVLAKRMDRARPVFTKGDQVALRRANGMMHRGTLIRHTETTVVLLSDSGRLEVPLDELDHKTRLTHDRAYREKFIAFQARRLLRQKQRQTDEPDA